ncbi:hypothetical protein OG874_42700 [Nocardia sp. NBC_00565]|uniref:hypothetical protein n=1 Tax=Nocardia sp. NBC_00565 TaxID=2975993 RepID=UPI002E806B5F|nr:hypothetical protein [Nocardia sp. NBC_00565]WUC03299.1 hypothetical protein OG874_42700 [Nocardia sp. NBC_00565]
MTDLVTGAQIVLLSRTLHAPLERLAHLERLGGENLHELQDRMAGLIFDQHNETFQRISKLVPLIPLRISMPLVQRLVPPMMTGRAAGAVGVDHPKKAAETVVMLAPAYVANCAQYMDPRTVGQLAAVAPPEPIVRILNEMLRRKDYITAGPFLAAFATPEIVAAIEQGVLDDEGLIFSSAYAYSVTGVSAILRHLLVGQQQRAPRMLHSVLVGSTALQLAALSVFARCEPDLIAAIGDILFSVGSTELIGNLVATYLRAGAAPELLTFVGHLSPWALDTLAANPIIANDAAIAGLVGSVNGRIESELWRGLFNLVEHADAGIQQRAVSMLAQLSDAMVAALPGIATDTHFWPVMLRLVAAGDTDVRVRFETMWSTLPMERRIDLEHRIKDLGLDIRLRVVTPHTASLSIDEVFYRRRKMRRRYDAVQTWD